MKYLHCSQLSIWALQEDFFLYFPHTNLFKCSTNCNHWEIKFCAPIALQQLGRNHSSSAQIIDPPFLSCHEQTRALDRNVLSCVLLSQFLLTQNPYTTFFLTSFSAETIHSLHHNPSTLQKQSFWENSQCCSALPNPLLQPLTAVCVHVLGPVFSAQLHSCLTICWHIQWIYGTARFVRI